MICRVEGCNERCSHRAGLLGSWPGKSKVGTCPMHKNRLRRYGDVNVVHQGSRLPATHCRHGHEYTPENSYVRPQGWKECLTCRHESAAGRRVGRHIGCIHGHPESAMILNTYGARICKMCRTEYAARVKAGLVTAVTPLIDPALRGHGWNRRTRQKALVAPPKPAPMYHAPATRYRVPRRGSGVPQEEA